MSAAPTQMTPKKLLELCKQAVANGYGDDPIVLSDDNEGNAYHGMFYGFTKPGVDASLDDYDFPIYDSQEDDPTKVIVLG